MIVFFFVCFFFSGFQFDYVFNWTILKYQQAQIVTPPPRAHVSELGLGLDRVWLLLLNSLLLIYVCNDFIRVLLDQALEWLMDPMTDNLVLSAFFLSFINPPWSMHPP